MDIQSLRERQKNTGIMSVSELNSYVKNILDSNSILSQVTVSGEISNFVNHGSGHLYFSLKDSSGQIRTVMFRSSAAGLRFSPSNGMKVIVKGSVSVYVKDGSYQLYATSMQPDGIGALYLAYEQLKEKLGNEGLFSLEYKKPIPKYPRTVGVITSPTGAAVRDIINIISRRSPSVAIYIYPALVQGEGAEKTLVKALDFFDRCGFVDTVIIGRGGGSIEDLWAFNSEALARRIFSMNVPVVSAVGHETDFTICDFVSDLRAPTPSAAAELVVPDARELLEEVDVAYRRCRAAALNLLKYTRQRYLSALDSPVIKDPNRVLEGYRERLYSSFESVISAFAAKADKKRADLTCAAAKLEALNPLAVLSRGFSTVSDKSGKIIIDSKDLKPGEKIDIRLKNGSLEATVDNIKG